MTRLLLAIAIVMSVPSVSAQDMTPLIKESAAQVMLRQVPVTQGDIMDRPYRVLGPVLVSVRKKLRISKPVSEEKLAKALWEQAQALGADAVIFAGYTPPQRGFVKNGERQASGRAIKFLSAPEG